MPTYLCYTRPGALTSGRPNDLAARLTAHHSRTPGAPASFVQVIFRQLDAADHYIGGMPVKLSTSPTGRKPRPEAMVAVSSRSMSA
jgi:phenylpyruvate tautomerase PptA (4-oxalocrotonate tautomerase family)